MAIIPPMTRRHSEIERKIHAALEDARSKQTTATRYIRLSSIGGCVRDLWAARQGIPDERPPEGRALMTFDVGHHLERAVTDWLREAGYEIVTHDRHGDQITVRMPDSVGIGHIDGMIRWGRPSDHDWRLLEVKTAKAKRFDELIELGSYRAWSESYYDQIQAYMGASTHEDEMPTLRDCLVVVVCKDDTRFHCEMIRFDSERYLALVEKARTALGAEMPDRPEQANGQYSKFCKWCSRATWCYSPIAGVDFDD